MNRRRAMFAGSFDPPTLGHLDIIKRAADLFEKLFVVIAVNPDKDYLFTSQERRKMLIRMTEGFDNVEVVTWEGFVVEFAAENDVGVLVRGIRSTNDYAYEYDMACLNRKLSPEIETVLIPANPELAEISSSLIKQMMREGQDISALVPESVLLNLTQKHKLFIF